MDWNRFRRNWPWTLFAAAVLVLQLGSRGDRIVVGAVWLALVLPPVERYIHHLAALTRRTVLLRYFLFSALGLICAWGNAPFRVGGPFHIVNADLWRGYPFMFEERYWTQGGLDGIVWHRSLARIAR